MIDGSAAGERAKLRIVRAEGSIRDALDSLDLGFDLDDVVDYVTVSVDALAVVSAKPRLFRARLAGIVAAGMIVAVEADRLSGAGRADDVVGEYPPADGASS